MSKWLIERTAFVEDEIVEANSLVITSFGVLRFLRGGMLYRAYNANQWVTVKELS